MLTRIAPIALMTDFGYGDGYVGIMKGVMTAIAPEVRLIDLSHGIPPQDLWAGRFCLLNAVSYFPLGTVFLGVVDPEVGSSRRGIAVQFERGYFVGPDNGLVSGILAKYPAIAAVSLTNSAYWRTGNLAEISSTFHGRDIFAPVAAHLARGIPMEQLGESLDVRGLKTLPIPQFHRENHVLSGIIQHIDHFGNLITTIPVEQCSDYQGFVELGKYRGAIAKTYSDVAPQNLCVILGSHGWLEISINQGNAQAFLDYQRGDRVWLKFNKIS